MLYAMTSIGRRTWGWISVILLALIFSCWIISQLLTQDGTAPTKAWNFWQDDKYFWKMLPVHYPPQQIRRLPTGPLVQYPKIQRTFKPEDPSSRQIREKRQSAIKDTFVKCWTSYKRYAWREDELSPVSGGRRNIFGGWSATLVDALDTMWIMGLKDEFKEAVDAATQIDFTKTDMDKINLFETNIRYLGGFLSAYDLSGDVRLLRKAVEVGEMLYKAFDTPNRMPIGRWDIHAAMRGEKQVAGPVSAAEIGTLSLEFTRLSQITGNSKWFDAIQRITDVMSDQQNSTALPGLWPTQLNPEKLVFNNGSEFTLGADEDSLYEYLLKMALLTGGRIPKYQNMYEMAVDTAVKHLIFRPMTPNRSDILISGTAHVNITLGSNNVTLEPRGQHLVCFLGGLIVIGSKHFSRPADLPIAEKLVDGCIWAYQAFPRGIMPEKFHIVPCPTKEPCEWREEIWKQRFLKAAGKDSTVPAESIISSKRLPPGFTDIRDPVYILRPEAIESVFILYRATGRSDLPDAAWNMFTSINEATSTALANSAIRDVTISKNETPGLLDVMESFWLAETLKYFYLMFSEDSVINLDEYVFNTEAHPFRRPLQ